ncbi:hypothetical protein AC249_AIPGENE10576 [Exaiptasia diaphana]|nr:hypothetical protein AC249_AIPGENE10576 [Exaiptasia diaphana]
MAVVGEMTLAFAELSRFLIGYSKCLFLYHSLLAVYVRLAIGRDVFDTADEYRYSPYIEHGRKCANLLAFNQKHSNKIHVFKSLNDLIKE